MPLPPETLPADALLLLLDAHEPLAQRWAAATLNLLRDGFAAAYRLHIGVLPAHRDELRSALEALRDGRTRGEVTVECILARLQSNDELGDVK